MKIKRIEVEGLYKTGKSTLVYYLRHLSKFCLAVSDRGIASSMALSSMFGKACEPPDDVDGSLVVYLIADKDDWFLRCMMTNEQPIPYDIY